MLMMTKHVPGSLDCQLLSAFCAAMIGLKLSNFGVTPCRLLGLSIFVRMLKLTGALQTCRIDLCNEIKIEYRTSFARAMP